ncbi:MAG: hypothetical protein AAB550_02860 [Patescibacteria group bacterium]
MNKDLLRKLTEAVGATAFKLFKNERFRKLIFFDSITQLEQDRIFNELVLAVLTVIMLTCDAPDIPEENKVFFQKIKDDLPKMYISQLRSMSIENKYLKQWITLINMRYQEYTDDKVKAREAAMIVESQDKDIDIKKLSEIQLMLPLQTVAIGCHHHICRGKTDGRDDLFKMIIRWLGEFYVEFRVIVEGKEISVLTRIKVGIRRLFR